MQTVIRSILGGLALGTLALGVGLAALFAAEWAGFGGNLWFVVAGACLTVTIIGVVSGMAMGGAIRGLSRELEHGDGSRLVSGPRWLRSVLRTLNEYQVRHQQGEAAWRTREQDLEIRARVADDARMQAEAVLEVMDDAVIVCNTLLEIISSNQAAGRLLGFDPATADGHSIAEIVKDHTLRRIITETLEAGVDVEPRRGELMLGDGSNMEGNACEVVSACAVDRQGRASAVVTVLHDLSREREISQMKSEFVSKASHELRTPLSSMRAYVEMLVDGEARDEDTRQEFYGIIQSETDRLARLVDNMLNISRIEAGIIEIERDVVDIHDLADRAVQTLEPHAREKHITLHTDIAPVGTMVCGDADMLQQVIVNLLSNGIKYTPEGGRVTVQVDADTLTRSVHVAVSDTGLGIAPHDAEHVFEKFFRVENYKRVAKGTGLGLNLCRHIIETVHQGQIGLESTLGMGSRFWFSVPMGQLPARVAA
ncbi:MAG: ATP-binding protein [Phycisphaerales bacterium]|nr:ATP-binding protein [Phycisphaerales bacterium]